MQQLASKRPRLNNATQHTPLSATGDTHIRGIPLKKQTHLFRDVKLGRRGVKAVQENKCAPNGCLGQAHQVGRGLNE